MDYFGERYYTSGLGRFTTVDPLGASAIIADPQSFNRFIYVLNNPLRYIDPDGLDTCDPWYALTEDARNKLASKLTTVKDPNNPTEDELNEAGKRFNQMATVWNNDGHIDGKKTGDNAASVQNFVDSLSGDSKVWDQIKSFDSLHAWGKGQQSDVFFTVKNKDDFLKAISETTDAKGNKRFQWLPNFNGHVDHYVELGNGVTDPSMHIEKNQKGGANSITAHWDPSSVLTKTSIKEVALDSSGPTALRRIAAGIAHWTGKASHEKVRGFLKEQGLTPQK